mmetsp:Transcript_46140/g.128354  ORF Transcript_46140/g.128354 Transcript_46140/m.128354 type:complete len:270 (-) Transcript_46140:153-962(-)
MNAELNNATAWKKSTRTAKKFVRTGPVELATSTLVAQSLHNNRNPYSVAASPTMELERNGAKFCKRERGTSRSTATKTKSRPRLWSKSIVGNRPSRAFERKSPMRTQYARHARPLFKSTETSAIHALSFPNVLDQSSPKERAPVLRQHHPSKKNVYAFMAPMAAKPNKNGTTPALFIAKGKDNMPAPMMFLERLSTDVVSELPPPQVARALSLVALAARVATLGARRTLSAAAAAAAVPATAANPEIGATGPRRGAATVAGDAEEARRE